MSTVITKNVQVGTSGTAAQNFTLYQPASPDGTVRLANGNSGSTTDLVTVTSAGNVGIGTSSPSTFSPNTTYANTAAITKTDQALSFGAYYQAGVDAYSFIKSSEVGSPTTATSLRFFGGSNERMRIDSSGNLLVGTTTANGRISSTTKAGFSPAGSAGTWNTAPAISVSGAFGGGFSWIDGPGGYCAWVDDGGTDFNIAGGLIANSVGNGVFLNGYAATSWSARSDERLKDKFEPITDAVNKVVSLRAVTGVYKNFPEDRQAFLFAQDVQKVLPEAVSVADKKSPEQYLGLAYTQVIPLLVAAIQEQQALIQSLTARITALETA